MARMASELPSAGTINPTDRLIVGRLGEICRADVANVQTMIRPGLPRALPVASDLPIWVNQGGATLTEVDGYGLVLQASPSGTAVNVVAAMRDVPAGSSWQATFCIRRGWPIWKDFAGGVCIGNLKVSDRTWKLLCFALPQRDQAGAAIFQYSSATQFLDSYNRVRYTYGMHEMFIRVIWNGTTYIWQFSMDGVRFVDYHYFTNRSGSVLSFSPAPQSDDKIGVWMNLQKGDTGYPNTANQLGLVHLSIET